MTNEAILETLKVQPLSEEEKQSRHILKRLTGPIASCKEGTRNGRKYNRELWEQALNDDIFKEKVANKSLFLELGHPDREEIDMKYACACIPEMPKIVNDDLYAVVDVLDTPNGKILNTLIDYGFIPGISSRGSGDVIGDMVDPETFMLETWDIVGTPALKKARLAVVEGLDNHQASLRKALCESLDEANEEDKKIMNEALQNLDINIEEDASTTNETSTPENGDDNITSVDINNTVISNLEQTQTEIEVANNDGTENIIKSLQEALKSNLELEAKVATLQNEIAVRDTKVSKLEEDISRSKSTIVRLTTLAKDSKEKTRKISALEEELQQIKESSLRNSRRKDETIKPLKESLTKKENELSSLNEQLETLKTTHENEVNKLNESIKSLTKEKETKEKELTESLNKSKKLLEKYKAFSNNVAQKYIEVRAKTLGVKKEDIMNRLSENYSLEEVDKVCEDLRRYKLNLSKLPFTLDNKSVVKINESKHIGINTQDVIDDDYIGEDTLRAAGLK